MFLTVFTLIPLPFPSHVSYDSNHTLSCVVSCVLHLGEPELHEGKNLAVPDEGPSLFGVWWWLTFWFIDGTSLLLQHMVERVNKLLGAPFIRHCYDLSSCVGTLIPSCSVLKGGALISESLPFSTEWVLTVVGLGGYNKDWLLASKLIRVLSLTCVHLPLYFLPN